MKTCRLAPRDNFWVHHSGRYLPLFILTAFIVSEKYFFDNLGLFIGLSLNGVNFWVTQSLEACSRLCIIVFKIFLIMMIWI